MTTQPDPSGQQGTGGTQPPNPAGQTGAPPAPGGAGDSSGAGLFTQEQVNDLLALERGKTERKFGDYEQMKTRLTELEAAGQTELEKAQAKLEESNAAAQRAVMERDQLVVRSAVTAAAARAGAIDPDVVVALLTDSFKVGANGEVDGDVNKAVTDLLEQRPYLKNGTPPPPTRGGADQGAGSRPPAATPSDRMDDFLRSAR